MKKTLFSALLVLVTAFAMAQQPTIEGDLMLCPESDGIAYVANDVAYDSYQWYVDFYPYGTFDPVPGATEESFTYDAYNYSLAKIKVVTTVGSNTYESNVLTIDSMVFLPISYMTELQGNAVFDPDQQAYVLCGDAASIITTVNNPYTLVQWFKNGVAIPGATNQQYVIMGPGIYYAVASPADCPNMQQTTLQAVVIACVETDPSPLIQGDIMLCPNSEGMAGTVANIAYDTYQWYADFWPYDDFEIIDGATQATFTYDWNTYDLSKIKLVVTLDGETYESNVLQIDSYNWAPMTIAGNVTSDVTFDEQTEIWLLCEGGNGFTNTVNTPYTTNIQWYKDGVAIEGATESSYTITTAGSYTVTASPGVCPDNSTTSTPIIVEMKNCSLGTDNPATSANFSVYPNPTKDFLNVIIPEGDFTTYTIFDVSGKALLKGSLSNQSEVNVSALQGGTYILHLSGTQSQASRLFIKL